MRTNHGQVVQPPDLLRSKLKTVGIGLIDRVPGPFQLAIDRIWATDRIRDADDIPAHSTLLGGKSKPNKSGALDELD